MGCFLPPSFYTPTFTILKHKMESEDAMKRYPLTPTPRSAHPLPDAHDHTCPHCGHTCVYFAEQPTHKCPLCLHVHTISTQDIANEYIHSPGGDDVVSDEEMKACVIVAECHAYSWRNKVSFGVWSIPKGRYIYKGRDDFGHLSLFFNYRNSVVIEIGVGEDSEWPSIMQEAWLDGGRDYSELIPNHMDKSRTKGDTAA